MLATAFQIVNGIFGLFWIIKGQINVGSQRFIGEETGRTMGFILLGIALLPLLGLGLDSTVWGIVELLTPIVIIVVCIIIAKPIQQKYPIKPIEIHPSIGHQNENIESLLLLLANDNPDRWKQAHADLVSIGKPVVPNILSLIKANTDLIFSPIDSIVAREKILQTTRAITILGEVKEESSISELERLSKSDIKEWRNAAQSSLKMLKTIK